MSGDDSGNETDGDAAAPDADAPAGDAHAQTLAALQGLPPRFRKVLMLREIEGLPMEEVAARLKLSRSAAERRWRRAVVLLTERLEKAP